MKQRATIIPYMRNTGWIRWAFAGLETVLLSFFLVYFPGLLAYLATASSPGLGGATWHSASRVCTELWFIALGGTVNFAGVRITFPILALIGLIVAFSKVFSGLAVIRSWPGVGTVALSQMLVAATIWAISGSKSTLLVPLMVVGLSGILGSWWAARRNDLELIKYIPYADRIPAVGEIYPTMRYLLGGLLLVGTVCVVGSVITHWNSFTTIFGSYGDSKLGFAYLLLIQILLIPTAVMWTLSWLAGPGFMVGTGTIFASYKVVSQPMPPIPLLAALPKPHSLTYTAVFLAIMAVGVVAGARLANSVNNWREFLVVTTLSLLLSGVVLEAALWLSSGSPGPGRLQVVGPVKFVAPLLLAELLAGMLLGLLLRKAATNDLLPALLTQSMARVKGQENRETESEEPVSELTDSSELKPENEAANESADTEVLPVVNMDSQELEDCVAENLENTEEAERVEETEKAEVFELPIAPADKKPNS